MFAYLFALIDEKPETDEGYVTLVNAKRDADGNIIECKERTGNRENTTENSSQHEL